MSMIDDVVDAWQKDEHLRPPRAATVHSVQTAFNDALSEAGNTPSGVEILAQCIGLADKLIAKNRAYGDSALKPLRVMSKSSTEEQILVRMDDKLSRMMRGLAAGEDPLFDLVGYWVLLQVARSQGDVPEDSSER